MEQPIFTFFVIFERQNRSHPHPFNDADEDDYLDRPRRFSLKDSSSLDSNSIPEQSWNAESNQTRSKNMVSALPMRLPSNLSSFLDGSPATACVMRPDPSAPFNYQRRKVDSATFYHSEAKQINSKQIIKFRWFFVLAFDVLIQQGIEHQPGPAGPNNHALQLFGIVDSPDSCSSKCFRPDAERLQLARTRIEKSLPLHPGPEEPKVEPVRTAWKPLVIHSPTPDRTIFPYPFQNPLPLPPSTCTTPHHPIPLTLSESQSPPPSLITLSARLRDTPSGGTPREGRPPRSPLLPFPVNHSCPDASPSPTFTETGELSLTAGPDSWSDLQDSHSRPENPKVTVCPDSWSGEQDHDTNETADDVTMHNTTGELQENFPTTENYGKPTAEELTGSIINDCERQEEHDDGANGSGKFVFITTNVGGSLRNHLDVIFTMDFDCAAIQEADTAEAEVKGLTTRAGKAGHTLLFGDTAPLTKGADETNIRRGRRTALLIRGLAQPKVVTPGDDDTCQRLVASGRWTEALIPTADGLSHTFVAAFYGLSGASSDTTQLGTNEALLADAMSRVHQCGRVPYYIGADLNINPQHSEIINAARANNVIFDLAYDWAEQHDPKPTFCHSKVYEGMSGAGITRIDTILANGPAAQACHAIDYWYNKSFNLDHVIIGAITDTDRYHDQIEVSKPPVKLNIRRPPTNKQSREEFNKQANARFEQLWFRDYDDDFCAAEDLNDVDAMHVLWCHAAETFLYQESQGDYDI